MKIYVFAESYPSPYKPYHDTQFAQFIKSGHALKVFAFDRHAGELSQVVRELSLDKGVVNLPATLKDLLILVLPVLSRLWAAPMVTTKRLLGAAKYPGSMKQRVVRSARAVLLPDEPPDLCLVHNLRTLQWLSFLKHVYPAAPLAFYYHGGEVPGVPQVSGREAASAFAVADVVFTNTESSRQHAIDRGCDANKIFITPVGFNLADFPDPVARTYRRDGTLNVLTVGRLSEEKGVIFALQAMLLLRQAHVSYKYRIVGNGPEKQRLADFVKMHALGDSVVFLGEIPSAQLMQEYASADVVLLPSVVRGTWMENQACVVQEAMLGRALAAVSRTGGVPESTAPELWQFSFEPEQPSAIAESLTRISQLDVAALERLGAGAREFVVGRYDIKQLNQELLDRVASIDEINKGRRAYVGAANVAIRAL